MLFHHEWLAVKKSLDSVLKHYPNSQIILGRDQLEPEENNLLENFSSKLSNQDLAWKNSSYLKNQEVA